MPAWPFGTGRRSGFDASSLCDAVAERERQERVEEFFVYRVRRSGVDSGGRMDVEKSHRQWDEGRWSYRIRQGAGGKKGAIRENG